MALEFFDSCGDYYSTAQIARVWDVMAFATVNTQYPRYLGGSHIKFYGSTPTLRKYLSANRTTVVTGVAARVEGFTNNAGIIQYLTGGTAQVTLTINTSGKLEVRTGSYTGSVIATSAESIDIGKWYYIEMKVLIGNSGTYEVKLNGTQILSGTGDTQGSLWDNFANRVYFNGNNTSGPAIYIDDVYIDTADFYNPCIVCALRPDANGNYAQWTPLAPNDNFDNVNDSAGQDDDTSYNVTAILNNIDTFSLETMPVLSTTVYGVRLSVFAKKDDANPRYITPITRVNGIDYVGTESVNLTTAYLSYSYIWAKNPNDPGNNWTDVVINASEFGYKLTTAAANCRVTQVVLQVLRGLNATSVSQLILPISDNPVNNNWAPQPSNPTTKFDKVDDPDYSNPDYNDYMREAASGEGQRLRFAAPLESIASVNVVRIYMPYSGNLIASSDMNCEINVYGNGVLKGSVTVNSNTTGVQRIGYVDIPVMDFGINEADNVEIEFIHYSNLGIVVGEPEISL